MPEEGAQRAGGDVLHQRVSCIVGSQTTVNEVARGRADEWAVAPGLPAPLQPERRTKPVKVDTYYHAARIGVVGQHITHRHGIGIRTVGEGDNDVVLL